MSETLAHHTVQNKVSNTFVAILSFTIVVPVIMGTILFRRLPHYGKYIVLFMYVNLFSEIASIILARLYGNNMVVFYFFASLGAIVIGQVYYKAAKLDLSILFFTVPLVAIAEWYIIGSHQFNNYSFTWLNLLIIAITLYSFYKMTLLEITEGMFYFNGILFFYAMSSSLFFFTARYLQQNDVSLMMKLFNVHSFINSITNILFAYSIWTLFKSYSSAR